jgi:hypothetical protein
MAMVKEFQGQDTRTVLIDETKRPSERNSVPTLYFFGGKNIFILWWKTDMQL